MKSLNPLIFLVVLVISSILVGCQSEAPDIPVELPETQEVIVEPTEAADPTAVSTLVPTEALPTPTDTAVPTPTRIIVPTEIADYCVDCHIEKEKLIDTADEEEEVVSENEGEG